MVKIEIEVATIRKSILWFWKKKIHFEVSYVNVTDYYYSLGDLVSGLINKGVTDTDIWRIINNIERKYYKIK